MTKSRWIYFELAHKGEKTCKWHVVSRKNDAVLGEIKWFGRWRQYVFFPVIGTIFNPDCMDHISEFIRTEMATRKERKEHEPIFLSEDEFKKLREYSASMPTGVTVGKCWKSYLRNGDWVHREYTEHPTDDTKVLVVTRDIIIAGDMIEDLSPGEIGERQSMVD